MKIAALFIAVLMLVSCVSKDVKNPERSPSAAAAGLDHDELNETYLSLKNISDVEEFKSKIRNWVRFYIILGAHTQKIVASFDEKLVEGLTTRKDDLNAVKQELKEIDCQLGEISYITHENEERLKGIYKAVLERESAELTDWFLERLAVATGYDTIPQIIARYNYILVLKNYHESICKEGACKKANFSKVRLRFPFDPYNNLEVHNYKKANNKSIALFSANPVSTQDSCLSRMPSAGDESLAKNFFGGKLPEGSFAVTYDDGPHAKHTVPILNIWKKSGLPQPVFFWLGKEAAKYPEIVKAVANENVEVASHSYSHADVGNISRAKSFDDLNQTNVKHFFPDGKKPAASTFPEWQEQTLKQELLTSIEILEGVLRQQPTSRQTQLTKFRFPYGSGYNNDRVMRVLKSRNMVHIHWMIDSLDWQDKNPLSVAERVKAQMKIQKKGIILFHDIHPQSVEASRMLVDYINSQSAQKIAPLDQAL